VSSTALQVQVSVPAHDPSARGTCALINFKHFLQEKAVEATKQEKERKEEKT
jgi:hypothetical protein